MDENPSKDDNDHGHHHGIDDDLKWDHTVSGG